MLKSSVEIPSADMLRRELQVRAQEAREEIKRDLEGCRKVSIALDAWTSPNHKAFLAIQAYYITSDWKYRYALIGFEELHGSHTGENIAKVVKETLKRYSLEGRLFAITTDNAGNNGTMAANIEGQLQTINNNIAWDVDILHIPCLAHVVQLVVTAFLKGIKVTATNEMLERSIGDDDVEEVRKMDKSFNKTLTMVLTL